MPKVIALWLGALVGACSPPPSAASGGAAADARLPCESPEQAGCAECCEEQPGPTPADQTCNLRRSAGRDYANEGELRNRGSCPATCRPCAACTRDRKRLYQRLRALGCDCFDPFVREVVNSIDPCFSGGCGCTCSYLAQMSECGPPSRTHPRSQSNASWRGATPGCRTIRTSLPVAYAEGLAHDDTGYGLNLANSGGMKPALDPTREADDEWVLRLGNGTGGGALHLGLRQRPHRSYGGRRSRSGGEANRRSRW